MGVNKSYLKWVTQSKQCSQFELCGAGSPVLNSIENLIGKEFITEETINNETVLFPTENLLVNQRVKKR